jgi:hypothetical protein
MVCFLSKLLILAVLVLQNVATGSPSCTPASVQDIVDSVHHSQFVYQGGINKGDRVPGAEAYIVQQVFYADWGKPFTETARAIVTKKRNPPTTIIAFKGSSNLWQLITQGISELFPKGKSKTIHLNGKTAVVLKYHWDYLERLGILKAVDINPQMKYLVTGHSLGGAVASLYGLLMTNEQQGALWANSGSRLITFGKPRVGKPDYVALHDQIIPPYKKLRIVNHNDPVPHLFYVRAGFRHESREIWIRETDNDYEDDWRVCSLGEAFGCSISEYSSNIITILFKRLKDHGKIGSNPIKNSYIKSVQLLAKNKHQELKFLKDQCKSLQLKIGTKGQSDCPAGYKHVGEYLCRNVAPAWFDKTFVASGCYKVEAEGCYYKGGRDIYYSTCAGESTRHNHRPVCALETSSSLLRGETLPFNGQLTSPNGQYRFIVQDDGNVVVYDVDKVLWSPNTYGKDLRDGLVFKADDGNLVLYDSTGKVIWSPNTHGKKASELVLNDGGFLVMYSEDRTELWTTQKAWRKDGRCGPNYRIYGGKPGQCDPKAQADEKGPCCSPKGWCGDSDKHCKCSSCVDYSVPWCAEKGIALTGKNIQYFDGIRTARECQYLCKHTEDCTFFYSYLNNDVLHRCHLMSGNVGRMAVEFTISGPRECTGTPGCQRGIFCHHPTSIYFQMDCDGDGIKDHVCNDAAGGFGILSSADGCRDTWPYGTCKTKSGGSVCLPNGWCSHDSGLSYRDCDGDGIPDPVCDDKGKGHFGVIYSATGCNAVWPNAPKCASSTVTSVATTNGGSSGISGTDWCYYEGQLFEKGEQFTTDDCSELCTIDCTAKTRYSCVPLCPKTRIMCKSNEEEVAEEAVASAFGCYCREPKCVPRSTTSDDKGEELDQISAADIDTLDKLIGKLISGMDDDIIGNHVSKE